MWESKDSRICDLAVFCFSVCSSLAAYTLCPFQSSVESQNATKDEMSLVTQHNHLDHLEVTMHAGKPGSELIKPGSGRRRVAV